MDKQTPNNLQQNRPKFMGHLNSPQQQQEELKIPSSQLSGSPNQIHQNQQQIHQTFPQQIDPQIRHQAHLNQQPENPSQALNLVPQNLQEELKHQSNQLQSLVAANQQQEFQNQHQQIVQRPNNIFRQNAPARSPRTILGPILEEDCDQNFVDYFHYIQIHKQCRDHIQKNKVENFLTKGPISSWKLRQKLKNLDSLQFDIFIGFND